MASENGGINAPDSWDQEDQDDSTSGVSKPASSLKLNANAAAFVPGKNPYANTFVPSFGNKNNQAVDSTPNPSEKEEEAMNTNNEVAANWEGETETQPEKAEMPEEKKIETTDDGGGEDEGIEELSEEEESAEEDEGGTTSVVKPKKIIQEHESGEKKDHVNVVFIGHVDAGKSTIGGHLMYLTGMVDKRTLEKYEREAKEKNRETWYLSWALDTNSEEREKGKTVEVGRAYFETEKKHFTILDAPGHKCFVPNMIGGASQADLAVLVISARRGEFETGFEKGGQTREHAMLVKTAGVKFLIVVINKMDDPTVLWSEERYNECKEKLIPYLRKVGFNPKTDIHFMPVSGMTGAFLRDIPDESICPWYRGPAFIEYIDQLNLSSSSEDIDKPVRMPIVDRYKDMGTILLGKLETGTISKNQTLTIMPNKQNVKVMQMWSDDNETDSANPGENLKIKVSGVEEEDITGGFVLCSPENLCHTGKLFDAQIVILEHKSIICAGYSAVLHLHTSSEEVTIKALLCIIDKKTGEKTQVKPRFVRQDQLAIARMEVNGGLICLETFKDFPQMGRFTLRDEGKTIGIGKVLKVLD